MKLHVRSFTAPGFGENTYLAWRDAAGAAVTIDPGNVVPGMLQLLEQEQLRLAAILLTHAHIDHIEGVARLVRETAAPVYLHPADSFLYEHAAAQAQQFGMHIDTPPPISHRLAHGQRLDIGDILWDVRHVPGHAPGHVLFHVADAGCAFAGDVVFQGSIGRTDLPGGDYSQLMQSIRQQVLTLPEDTVLYTGHGPATTVGHEGATNPFLIPHYGGGLA